MEFNFLHESEILKLSKKYPDATKNELFFLAEINKKYLSIDKKGRIWRHYYYFGKDGKWLNRPKRAEYKTLQEYLVLKKGLYQNGKRKTITVRAHRIVYMYYYGNIEKNLVINHKDAVKSNNSPDNIETITISQNVQHAKEMNLIKPKCLHGEKNKNSKLQPKDIIAIRNLRKKTNLSYQKIADMFGVTKRNIICIIKRTTWTHI